MNNLLYLSLAVLLLSPAASRADECKRYVDSAFHYSICAPRDWKKGYHEDGDRHYLTLRRGKTSGAEIVVTASRASDTEELTWDAWKKRQVRGSGFRKIIETKALAAGSNVTVKIFVSDFHFRGTRMLQRTMLSKYGDNLLVVDCRAPLASFGRYTDLFNTVMSSIDYTGTMPGDVLEETKEEKAAARKQAVREKKAVPKKPVESVKPREPKKDSYRPRKSKEKPGTVPSKKREALLEAEVKPDTEKPKGEDTEIDIQDIEDPEARQIIETELKTLQDMERRGLIERIDGK